MARALVLSLGRWALVGTTAAVACGIPTAVCGCPPARSAVFVRGTLTDAAGRAVAGARVYLDGVAPEHAATFPLYPSGLGDAQTDAAGAFGARVYSSYSPGTLTLRAAVVRPGLADTVRLPGGTARFRYEGDRPDTVSLALRLP